MPETKTPDKRDAEHQLRQQMRDGDARRLIARQWHPQMWGTMDCDRCPARGNMVPGRSGPCHECTRWPGILKEFRAKGTVAGIWINLQPGEKTKLAVVDEPNEEPPNGEGLLVAIPGRTLWGVISNQDLTEGRGRSFYGKVAQHHSTAIRLGRKKYVMGQDAPVEEFRTYMIDGREYFPRRCFDEIHPMTPEDVDYEQKLKRIREARAKADAAGLTPEDIRILAGDKEATS